MVSRRGYAAESSAGIRITIWRPYTPERTLTFQWGETNKVTVVGSDMQLQQEAFTWQSREDIWGGIVDSDLRLTLNQRFLSDFEPILSPGQRGFDKLRNFLVGLDQAVPEAEWSDSSQQLEEDGETAYRLNALLAFHTQLSWIYEVFKDTPGASVSVR